jgi:hypothetical protein
VWVARQPNGAWFDETADRHPDRTSRSAAAGETYLAEAIDEAFDVIVLRCGFLYAPDSAHTRQFGRSLLTRDLPVVGRGVFGRGDARLSFLHADDAAGAFTTAIDGGLTGTYHVVDDRPTTLADFLTTFARNLNAPRPRRLPAWLARFLIGAENTTLLSKPMPTSNDRFRDATGWEPRHPSHEEGLAQVVATWVDDGTLWETVGGVRVGGLTTSQRWLRMSRLLLERTHRQPSTAVTPPTETGCSLSCGSGLRVATLGRACVPSFRSAPSPSWESPVGPDIRGWSRTTPPSRREVAAFAESRALSGSVRSGRVVAGVRPRRRPRGPVPDRRCARGVTSTGGAATRPQASRDTPVAGSGVGVARTL